MNVKLLNLIWHPLEVARHGLAELAIDNNLEPNKLTILFGENDWMDRRGAIQLEQLGILQV